MIQLSQKNSLILLILFVTSSLFSQDTDLFSEKNIEEYAVFLYNSNQYTYAAEEYERLVYLNRSNPAYQIGLLRSYRYAGEYARGIKAYDLLRDPQVKPGLDLVKEYSKINLLDHNTDNLKLLLNDPGIDNNFKNNLDLTMRLISYPEYTLSLEGLDRDVLNKSLLDLYNESFTLHYKSRFVAGSLSAIVPGLGKVYAGRWKDAIISFIFVTGTGYQAYRAFSEKGVESVYGWIMGSLSMGFYLGNIYGSAKAARLYNTNQNQRYREKVTDYYIHHYE